MSLPLTQEDKVKRGAEDSARYFRYMTEFVGFATDDALAIRESSLVIEKHIPGIVSDFYAHLLRYPPTRKHFLKKDGTLDEDYLQKRMFHLSNFWRRTASGEYDEDYARYVDYVGRAHTSHGADPNIYIAERYVIGQVGFMQRAISDALTQELHEYDPDLESRSVRAWNKLMMVILEMLARAYRDEHEIEVTGQFQPVDESAMHQLAVASYELELGLTRPLPLKKVRVAAVNEIPQGERKIVQIGDLSIGVFHHRDQWVALRNHCLHRGGPVCTGSLDGDILTCPWHGYQYNVTSGQLLVDPNLKLDGYPVSIEGEGVFLTVPESPVELERLSNDHVESPVAPQATLKANELLAAELKPGHVRMVKVGGEKVAVYNVDGAFYATNGACTHEGGPLYEGDLEGATITCPWHGSCFDVRTGKVLRGPAKEPVRTYAIHVDLGVVRVENASS